MTTGILAAWGLVLRGATHKRRDNARAPVVPDNLDVKELTGSGACLAEAPKREGGQLNILQTVV
jgi:hypothetical protein